MSVPHSDLTALTAAIAGDLDATEEEASRILGIVARATLSALDRAPSADRATRALRIHDYIDHLAGTPDMKIKIKFIEVGDAAGQGKVIGGEYRPGQGAGGSITFNTHGSGPGRNE